MKPLNVGVVVGTGLGTLAIGALVAALLVRYAQPFTVTPLISLLFLLVGIWLLVGGRAVRRLKARRETWVTPIGATRIAVLSRSSAYVMAGCAGFLGGVAAVSFTRLWAPAMAFAAWSALAGAVTAIFATTAAIIVERWCIDSDGDEDDPEPRGRDASAQRPVR